MLCVCVFFFFHVCCFSIFFNFFEFFLRTTLLWILLYFFLFLNVFLFSFFGLFFDFSFSTFVQFLNIFKKCSFFTISHFHFSHTTHAQRKNKSKIYLGCGGGRVRSSRSRAFNFRMHVICGCALSNSCWATAVVMMLLDWRIRYERTLGGMMATDMTKVVNPLLKFRHPGVKWTSQILVQTKAPFVT